MIGDLNATHTLLGHTRNNTVRKGLKISMKQGKLLPLGPNFPTHHHMQASTTQDIILANNKVIHNTIIEQGPLTTLNHIPIIVSLTAKAVTNTVSLTFHLKKANWDKLKNEIEREMKDISLEENMSKENTDYKLKSWYSIIEKAMNNDIPTITTIATQKPVTNSSIKYIQYRFQQLQQIS